MEIPIVVAVVAVVVALASTITAWRLLIQEQRRSAARVTALVSATDGRARSEPAGALDGRPHRELDEPGGRPVLDEPRVATPTTGILAEIVPPRDGSSVGDLFGATRRPGIAPSRLILAVAVGVLTVATVAVAIFTAGTGDGPTPRAVEAIAEDLDSLELLALSHARDGEVHTISGLVRNPSTGAEARHVTVAASLLDHEGAFLGEAEAPLALMTLMPGDESAFEVAVVAPTPAERYRVSFRADDGGILQHVDQRSIQTDVALEGEGGAP